MARSERFELPTLGIEIRCSIQLSYERIGLGRRNVGLGVMEWRSGPSQSVCIWLRTFQSPVSWRGGDTASQAPGFADWSAFFLADFFAGFVGSGCSAACFMDLI